MSSALVVDQQLSPRGLGWPENDAPVIIVHRFPHAPPDWPEALPVTAVDLDVLRHAGRFEPADTDARLDLLAASLEDIDREDVPHWLVFDTAFFATLPERARHTALPADLAELHGIYRTGRHGPVHRRAATGGRCISITGGEVITVAALDGGAPRECTAGLTALEGVPGAQTSGDLDPAAILYLMEPVGLSLDEVEAALTTEGGLAAIDRGQPDRTLSQRILVHRLRRAIGRAAVVLDGVDGVVWSGGLDPSFAALVGEGLPHLGLEDPARHSFSPWNPLNAAGDAALAAAGLRA